jgi:hypothetical protein
MDKNAFFKTALGGTLALTLLAIFSNIGWIGWVFGCLMLPAFIFTGAMYGYFFKQSGRKVEMIPTAVYGGLATALASVLPLLVSDGILALCCGVWVTGLLGALGGMFYAIFED